jgi:allantoin racemase
MRHEKRYFNRNIMKSDVRLLVITPVHPQNGDEGPYPVSDLDRRLLLLTTQVDEILCAGAPAQIYSTEAIKMVTPMVVNKAQWGESKGYDAIVINCMVDPGAREAQDYVKIPVIGIGRAATALASVVGDRSEFIYPHEIPVTQLTSDKAFTLKRLREYANQHIQFRGADVITLGCTYLGGASQHLQSEIGVPVIPTIDVGLRFAELIVLLNIRPEKENVESRRAPKYRRNLFEIGRRLRDLVRSIWDTLH